jgi:cell division protein FtsZ
MSEDTLASDVDTASKMITEAAAPDVQFIFGAAFKEDMQDEMTITVIAADFSDDDGKFPFQNNKREDAASIAETKEAAAAEVNSELKDLEDSLINDKMDYGQPAAPRRQDDFDMSDIFSILGGN